MPFNLASLTIAGIRRLDNDEMLRFAEDVLRCHDGSLLTAALYVPESSIKDQRPIIAVKDIFREAQHFTVAQPTTSEAIKRTADETCHTSTWLQTIRRVARLNACRGLSEVNASTEEEPASQARSESMLHSSQREPSVSLSAL